jgi:hypothetical protein
VLGSPLAGGITIGEGFIYSRCHQHYHFAGYALYQLLDPSGKEVIRGKKRAFCLEDFGPLQTFPLPRPMQPRYTCDFQGISVGWADTYANGLTCQYIDLTGLAPGRYTLRVTVNPDRVFPELTYDNNVAEAVVDIPVAHRARHAAVRGLGERRATRVRLEPDRQLELHAGRQGERRVRSGVRPGRLQR